jgi:hypothetical protein
VETLVVVPIPKTKMAMRALVAAVLTPKAKRAILGLAEAVPTAMIKMPLLVVLLIQFLAVLGVLLNMALGSMATAPTLLQHQLYLAPLVSCNLN